MVLKVVIKSWNCDGGSNFLQKLRSYEWKKFWMGGEDAEINCKSDKMVRINVGGVWKCFVGFGGRFFDF